MTRYIRVQLQRTDVTHLMCIHCGRFRTEFAIVTADKHDDTEPQAGIHRACIKKMHAKRTRKVGAGARTTGGDVPTIPGSARASTSSLRGEEPS